MMAWSLRLTLGLQHPQHFVRQDRHRGDAGHRNDDGDGREAEEGPEHHDREVFWSPPVIMSNEFSLMMYKIN